MYEVISISNNYILNIVTKNKNRFINNSIHKFLEFWPVLYNRTYKLKCLMPMRSRQVIKIKQLSV